MKKGIIALLCIIAAGGAGAGAYQYWSTNIQTETEGERVSSDSNDAVYVDSVTTIAGLESGNGKIQRFAGSVEPQKTWEVKLENDEKVAKCFVEVGDVVKVGDKLFTYDTSENEDKLAQDEIDLERCDIDIETAQNRITQLEKEKSKANADDQLSYTTQILQEENSIKQNEYEKKSKQLEIDNLKEAIKDSVVYSEMDGVIQTINDQNDSSGFDSSSDNVYIKVLQVGDFRIKGKINEQNIDRIYEGMNVLVHSRVDSSIYWTGSVSEIDRENGEANQENSYFGGNSDSSGNSTSYPFYVHLDSSDGLMLGQHVYIEENQGQADKKDGIWIDDYYFMSEDGVNYTVWSVSAANKLELRPVTLGEYDEVLGKYEVLEGLTGDDYIAVPFDAYVEGLPVIYNDFSDMDNFFMDDYSGVAMDDFSNFGDPDGFDDFDEFDLAGGDDGIYYADDDDEFDLGGIDYYEEGDDDWDDDEFVEEYDDDDEDWDDDDWDDEDWDDDDWDDED